MKVQRITNLWKGVKDKMDHPDRLPTYKDCIAAGLTEEASKGFIQTVASRQDVVNKYWWARLVLIPLNNPELTIFGYNK